MMMMMMMMTKIALLLLCTTTIHIHKTNAISCIKNTNIKIALMGDSLVSQAYFNFNLNDQIMDELRKINSRVSYNISFQCFASGGSAIVNIKNGQLWPTIYYKPNGTILFWDTDCSGVDENIMTAAEVDQLRSNFQANVQIVTQMILNHTGSLMALSGPGVLGDDQIIKMAT